MGYRFLEGSEGAIQRERDASRDDLRFRKASIVFVDFDEARDPEGCGAWEYGSDLSKIEIARAALRKADVAHGLEWNANEEIEPTALRFDKCLDGDIVWDIVSNRGTRPEQKQNGQNRDKDAGHGNYTYLAA